MIIEDYIVNRFAYQDEELLELTSNLSESYTGLKIDRYQDSPSHRIFESGGGSLTYFCFAVTDFGEYEIILDREIIERVIYLRIN